jgi:hypothetical protein
MFADSCAVFSPSFFSSPPPPEPSPNPPPCPVMAADPLKNPASLW